MSRGQDFVYCCTLCSYIKKVRNYLLSGCHAVINTFGQPNKAIPLYSEVTEVVIQVMKELSIKRYIGVTGDL